MDWELVNTVDCVTSSAAVPCRVPLVSTVSKLIRRHATIKNCCRCVAMIPKKQLFLHVIRCDIPSWSIIILAAVSVLIVVTVVILKLHR